MPFMYKDGECYPQVADPLLGDQKSVHFICDGWLEQHQATQNQSLKCSS
jgi:hypothetical protein